MALTSSIEPHLISAIYSLDQLLSGGFFTLKIVLRASLLPLSTLKGCPSYTELYAGPPIQTKRAMQTRLSYYNMTCVICNDINFHYFIS